MDRGYREYHGYTIIRRKCHIGNITGKLCNVCVDAAFVLQHSKKLICYFWQKAFSLSDTRMRSAIARG